MQNTEHTTARNPGDLTHPSREDWMAHLYGEGSREERDRLAAHLEGCAECQTRVREWRATMATLDEWQLPAIRRTFAPQPFLKWAAAAALVLGLGVGFSVAHISETRNLASLRHEMQAGFQQQLDKQRAQLITEVSRVVEERSLKDSGVTLAALREMNAAHRADYDSLHKELETMAVLTEGRLRQTHDELVDLASTTEPVPSNTIH